MPQDTETTENMRAGTSQADCAVLLADAGTGESEEGEWADL